MNIEQAIAYLTSCINQVLNKDCRVGVMFVDIIKASDTVNHSILAKKLRRYEINRRLLHLIISLLSGRIQRIIVSGSISEPLLIRCGNLRSSKPC